MMVRFRHAILLVPVALAASSVGVSAPTSQAATVTINFATSLPDNFRAAAYAEQLSDKLSTSNSFASVRIVASGIEVDLTGTPTAGESTAISGVVKGGLPVSVKTVKYSNQQLMGTYAQIGASAQTWQARGVQFASFGLDPASDKVEVDVVNADPGVAALLQSAYGDSVEVHLNQPRPTPADRAGDYSPFWGGDRVTGPESCTGWVPYINGAGYHVIMISGHCGTGSWTIGSSCCYTVAHRYYDSTGDFEELSAVANTHGCVYSDGPAGTSYPYDRQISSWNTAGTDPVGGVVATDGYASREIHGGVIQSGVFTVYYGDGIGHGNQIKIVGNAGQALGQSGDSGAPVYSIAGDGSAKVYGMLNSFSGSLAYYQPVRSFTAAFGGGPDTSSGSC